MISDLDTIRAAHILIREHGEDAALEAGMRTDSMLGRGNIEGQQAWKRILEAVKELQRTELGEGEQRH